MAIDKLPHHYSMTSPASAYDEEALTTLELAARTTGKINEVVEQTNRTTEKVNEWDERLPNDITAAATKQVDAYLKNGTFDKAIEKYAGNVNARVDQLFANVPEGSTAMDAEIIDARLGGNGVTYDSLGEATRNQFGELYESATNLYNKQAHDYGYRVNYNRPSLWVQGWISSETGEQGFTGVDLQCFLSTPNFIDTRVERVETTDGERIAVYRYGQDGAFIDRVEGFHPAYNFDHASYKYKLAISGAMPDFSTTITKYDIRKEYIYPENIPHILLLGHPIEPTDAVTLHAQEEGYSVDYNTRAAWEQGYIFGSTGLDGMSASGWDFWLYNRARGYIPADVERVAVSKNYLGRLFYYEKDGAFIKNESFTGQSVALDHETYLYRVDVKPTGVAAGHVTPVHETWNTVKFLGGQTNAQGLAASAFIPSDVLYGDVPNGYYHAGAPDADFRASTLAAAVYEKFDALTESFPHFVTKTKLGDACDGQPLNMYRIAPPTVTGTRTNPRPKIIVIGGQHGFEKANVYGLYYFVRDLCERFTIDDTLGYLRGNVEFVVVPVANPSGFDARSYKNANGVNLNRNYDFNWSYLADNESEQFGGESAFDQPETAAIRNLIETEDNVCLVVDSHSMGSGSVPSAREINWVCCCNENALGYDKLRKAAQAHLSRQAAHFIVEYLLTPVNGGVGYYEGFMGTGNTTPSLDNWCVYNKQIVALTLEGFNGFPNTAAHTAECHKANAEIIGNFVLAFCREYGRV